MAGSCGAPSCTKSDWSVSGRGVRRKMAESPETAGFTPPCSRTKPKAEAGCGRAAPNSAELRRLRQDDHTFELIGGNLVT